MQNAVVGLLVLDCIVFDLVSEALGLMIAVLGLGSVADYLPRAGFAIDCWNAVVYSFVFGCDCGAVLKY